MRRWLAILLCSVGFASTAMAADPDQEMNRYFSIWNSDSTVNLNSVAHIYARQVNYYGKLMTPAQVYRDKLNYIRQWPFRKYWVVPGSVSKDCNPAQTTCRITAILSWKKVDRSGRQGSKGANTITLTTVQENGVSKIARESGASVAQSECGETAQGPWHCLAYR